MKRLLATLFLTSHLVVAAPAQVPQGDLAALLPSNTMVFFSIDDVSRVFNLDQDGAIRTLLRHEAVQQAYEEFYGMLGELKDKDFLLALDLEEEELARLFTGRVTFAIPEINLVEKQIEATSRREARVSLEFDLGRGLILLADFGATRDRFEELLENIAKLAEEEEDVNRAGVIIEEFENTRLYNLEVEKDSGELDEPVWMALVDGLFLVSDREETLKDYVDLAQHDTDDGERLLDDPRYQDTLDRVGRSDSLLYVNLDELLPLVNDFIRHQLEEAGPQIEMFLRIDDLLAALSLDAIKSLFASGWVEDEEAGLVFGLTHADTDHGLHTLLTYDDSGVEIPSYFSSDFHSASISRFDLSGAWENFDRLLHKASPYAHTLLKTQIARYENTGFELRAAFLENLDAMVVECLGYPEETLAGPDDHPTQAFILRVRDPQTLAESLAELADEMADEDPLEFMNEQIYQIPMPFSFTMNDQDSAKLSFTVVGNYLVAALGETKMVENLISHIKNPGESLLDDPDLMAAFDALPSEDQVALGFVDVADLLTNTLRGGEAAILFQASREEGQTMGELLKAKKIIEELPDVSDVRYYIVSKTYRSPDSFVQRMLLRKNLEQ